MIAVLYLLGALAGLALMFRSTTILVRNLDQAATRRRNGGDAR